MFYSATALHIFPEKRWCAEYLVNQDGNSVHVNRSGALLTKKCNFLILSPPVVVVNVIELIQQEVEPVLEQFWKLADWSKKANHVS